MAAFCYTVALAWSYVPPPADGVAFPLWAHVEAARGVVAIERALAFRLPADPTAAEVAKRDAVGETARAAGMLTRLSPWAMRRIGHEMTTARAAEAAAWGTRQAVREGERAKFLSDLYMRVCAPK